MVLSAEIAAAIPHRGPCGLDQRGTQPSVAFARAPAAALAGALMVARADPRPGGGLRGRWEAPHVVPELGENLLGAAAADARDRIEPLNRWPKRARLLLDPLVEARDLLVEEFDVVQQPLEHEGVMQREAPDEGLAQRFRLLPECAARQVREPLRITFPGNEGVQHGAPGDAKDIGGDIAELDVGGLQHFLHSVGFAGVLLNKLSPVACQLTQLAKRRRRHEAPPQQAVLKQLREPLAVLDVGLATGHGLDMLRVDEQDLETGFKNVVHRPPVHAGALHRDVRAARRRQPVGQPEQLARCRAEGAYFLGTSARAGKPQAGSDRLLVHIEAAAHWVEHVHRRLLAARLRRRDSLREYPPRAPRRWQGRQFEVPTSRLGHNFLGLAAPILGPDLPRSRAVAPSVLRRRLSFVAGGACPMINFRKGSGQNFWNPQEYQHPSAQAQGVILRRGGQAAGSSLPSECRVVRRGPSRRRLKVLTARSARDALTILKAA